MTLGTLHSESVMSAMVKPRSWHPWIIFFLRLDIGRKNIRQRILSTGKFHETMALMAISPQSDHGLPKSVLRIGFHNDFRSRPLKLHGPRQSGAIRSQAFDLARI